MVRVSKALLKDAGSGLSKTLSEILVCPLSKQPLRVCEQNGSIISDSIGVSFPGMPFHFVIDVEELNFKQADMYEDWDRASIIVPVRESFTVCALDLMGLASKSDHPVISKSNKNNISHFTAATALTAAPLLIPPTRPSLFRLTHPIPHPGDGKILDSDEDMLKDDTGASDAARDKE
ncbi:hypothetical protein Pint_28510 [Pistacia integerrima]|uniref:Uncharacterized protein n=1 Tax=Pistacia integerrima TaxID=434235 RepID=A0ACC0YPZ2_9ROSI|nr:hypothetical protein Pint_28510 [Pistacia integerrima]